MSRHRADHAGSSRGQIVVVWLAMRLLGRLRDDYHPSSARVYRGETLHCARFPTQSGPMTATGARSLKGDKATRDSGHQITERLSCAARPRITVMRLMLVSDAEPKTRQSRDEVRISDKREHIDTGIDATFRERLDGHEINALGVLVVRQHR